MTKSINTALTELRADYESVTGAPFTHFFCPILFHDDDVPLCRGHIVNRKFPNSPRTWTVQRKDVDGFYGSNFEADFVVLRHRRCSVTPVDALLDPALSRDLQPKFILGNETVEHFPAHGDVPDQFTALQVASDGRSALFGLKIAPGEFHSAYRDLDIVLSRDLRLHALVSLIKSAHLCLFSMLGYSYVLSLGGRLVGRDILGEFFLANNGRPKPDVLAAADPFFRRYVHLVRPAAEPAPATHSTIENGECLLCTASFGYWAVVVFIRTDQQLHAVMIPFLGSVEALSVFHAFLNNERQSIEVRAARYDQAKRHWEASSETTDLHWPKTGILYP